jgi:hypothetical protein
MTPKTFPQLTDDERFIVLELLRGKRDCLPRDVLRGKLDMYVKKYGDYAFKGAFRFIHDWNYCYRLTGNEPVSGVTIASHPRCAITLEGLWFLFLVSKGVQLPQ